MDLKIWSVRIDSDRYRTFQSKGDLQIWHTLLPAFRKGELLRDEWKPIYRDTFREGGSLGDKPIPDFTRGVVTIAISERAKLILEPLVGSQVELLPFSTPVGTYFEMNVMFADCLDLADSKVERSEDSGCILKVAKYSFIYEKLDGVHIFRLPDFAIGIFVSDTFKQFVSDNGLTGMMFFPA